MIYLDNAATTYYNQEKSMKQGKNYVIFSMEKLLNKLYSPQMQPTH